MRYSLVTTAILIGLAVAAPLPQNNCGNGGDGASIIADLQATFDRDNPNGTPANGSPDDLNGDGVINAFEAGAQAGKKRQAGNACVNGQGNGNANANAKNNNDNTNDNANANNNANNDADAEDNANGDATGDNATGGNIVQQLQNTFDRNNPNGTPAAPGDPDDLNGDGVINVFEAGAQAGKR